MSGIEKETRERIQAHIRSLRTLLAKDGADIGLEGPLQRLNAASVMIMDALSQHLNVCENSAASSNIQKAVMLLSCSHFHPLISEVDGLKQIYGEATVVALLKDTMGTELAK